MQEVNSIASVSVYHLTDDSLTGHLTTRLVQTPRGLVRVTPSSWRTDVDGTVHPVYPAWYSQYLRAQDDPEADLSGLLTALMKEIMIQGQPAVTSLAVRGRITVSNALPPGTFSFTRDSIIVNELQHPAWDADGDLLSILFYTDAAGYLRSHERVNPVTGVRGRVQYSTNAWRFSRGQRCPGVKYPLTMSVTATSILQYVPFTDLRHEVPYDLTSAELAAHLAQNPSTPPAQSRRDLFVRAYSSVPVGQAYNGEWTKQLWDSEDLGDLHARQDWFLTPRLAEGAEPGSMLTTPLYDIIEGDMLKRVRANDGGAAEAVYVGPNLRVNPEFAMYSISTNGLGKKSFSQLSWLLNIPDLQEHLEDVCDLRLRYHVPEDLDFGQQPEITQHPAGLIRRLLACKLLRVQQLPHASGVPAYLVTLCNQHGNVCGLRGIQQGEKVFGIQWQFVILPVLDVRSGVLRDPLDHMNECSALRTKRVWDPASEDYREVTVPHSNGIPGVDDRILNPTTGEVVRRLFEQVWSRELSKVKGGAKDAGFYWRARDVVRFLTAYAGKYGVMVQTIEQKAAGGAQLPRRFVLQMVSNALIVDHGQAVEDPEEAFEAFERAQMKAGVRVAPFSKGTDPQVRKHALAHAADDRYPAYAKNGPVHNTNPRRASMMLSQLLQSSTPVLKLNTVITLSAPLLTPVEHEHARSQVKITARGLDKTRAQVFNPRMSPVRPDTGCCAILERDRHGRPRWVSYFNDQQRPHPSLQDAARYLREKLEAEELNVVPTYWEQVTDHDFAGGSSLVWIEASKPTSDVGKLVCPYGSKFVPMFFPETIATFADGSQAQVDLLYPVHEAQAKNVLEHFLTHAHPVQCETATGEKFLAYFAQLQFVRTGAASENTDVRVEEVEIEGIGAHLVSSAMRACGFPDSEVRVPRSEYVCNLHSLLLSLVGEGGYMDEEADQYQD